MLVALLTGLVLGFVGSIPVAGPTAVIVAESALDDRPRRGLAIATGAAVAESLYALIAFWGLTAILTRYPMLRPISKLVAGAILCVVGLYLMRRRTRSAPQSERPKARHAHDVLFGFTITLLNPTLAVTWTVASGVIHAALPARFTELDAFPFALGVCVGIVSWFLVLLQLVCKFRKSVSPAKLDRFVRAAGGVLVGSGVVMAGRALFAYAKTF
jgi:threonine/homoserine/homoserine lactone efflux protein